tara:strand:+ start:3066 stop:4172 length:1107 start_codon:yes stop_codon:yes gene_type:complete
MMQIGIRTDASVKMGSGHVMRCLTLANSLKKEGCYTTFISRKQSGDLNKLIINNGFNIIELPKIKLPSSNNNLDQYCRLEYRDWLGTDEIKDAEDTIIGIGKLFFDLLIVDHYAIGEKWETRLRPYAKKIMVIDDLADRSHDCDIILDQNWFENLQNRYNEYVPSKCIRLLGPKYALLRSEFYIARKNIKFEKKFEKRIFVFFGSSDPENLTEIVLNSLSKDGLSEIHVDVVLGKNNPNQKTIKFLVNKRPNTNLHIQIENISSIMSKSDLAIASGGVNTWERMMIGLPSIVIITAENQRKFTEDLAKNNFILYLGDKKQINVKKIYNNVKSMINDKKKLSLQRKLGLELLEHNNEQNIVKKITHILQ